MIPFSRFLAAAFCACFALLTVGCAQYEYQRPGATTAQIGQDSYACEMEAARAYPTQTVQKKIGNGLQGPTTTNCTGSDSVSEFGDTLYGSSSASCTTSTGAGLPPLMHSYDANEGNREKAVISCMSARGYRRVQVK